jgi:hypothetical protein
LGDVLRSVDRGSTWTPIGQIGAAVNALVVDPSDRRTLYAGTDRGVHRSADGGATWRSFNAGLFPESIVESLVIDPTGARLHAGTGTGVFDVDIGSAPPPGACAPGADHLCLFGSRFRVDLIALDVFRGGTFAAQAIPGDDRFGSFAFPPLTGDATLPEVFVKIVDATALPGQGHWVSFSSMSSVAFLLTITDTVTGLSREYLSNNFCGQADVGAFPPTPVGGSVRVAGTPPRAARRASDDPELSLLSDRFRIRVTATNPATEAEAAGLAVPQTDRFGFFSLPTATGDPGRPEIFVKMIDATSLPEGTFWFFHSSLTHFPYTLEIFDSVTGQTQHLESESSNPVRPCGGAVAFR